MWKMSVKLCTVQLIYIYKVEWLNDELGRVWWKTTRRCVHGAMRTHNARSEAIRAMLLKIQCWVCSAPKIDGISPLRCSELYTCQQSVIFHKKWIFKHTHELQNYFKFNTPDCKQNHRFNQQHPHKLWLVFWQYLLCMLHYSTNMIVLWHLSRRSLGHQVQKLPATYFWIFVYI